MSLYYLEKENQILAIEGPRAFGGGKEVGQLKFRIKHVSDGLALSIDDLGVSKDYQRKGIGSELTKRAIEIAIRHKCDFVVALAQPDYLSILSSLGFEINGFLARLSLK